MGSGARARSRSFKPRDNCRWRSRRALVASRETNGGGAASLTAARLSFGTALRPWDSGIGAGPAARRGRAVSGTGPRGRPRPVRTAARRGGAHRGKLRARARSPPTRRWPSPSIIARSRTTASRGRRAAACTCGRGWNERVGRLSETLTRGLVAAAVPATRGAHDARRTRDGVGTEAGERRRLVGDSPTGDDDILLYDGGDEGGARGAATAAETRGGSESPVRRARCPWMRRQRPRRELRRRGRSEVSNRSLEASRGGSYRMAPPEEVAAAVDIAAAADPQRRDGVAKRRRGRRPATRGRLSRVMRARRDGRARR